MQEENSVDFKKATDELLANVTLEELAKALGVSVQAVRQARAAEGTAAHRTPPKGWAPAAKRLAKARARELLSLAKRLEQNMNS